MDDRYVAGLFDGEGYVRIFKKVRKNHTGYYIAVGLGMTYYPIIKALHEEYGGSYSENRHDLRNSKNRIQFTWHVHNKIGANFLHRIRPYVVVKKDELEIALALQDHIEKNKYISSGRNHMTERKDRDQILAYREDLFQRIKALKKRSFPPLLNKRPKVSEPSPTR